MYIRDFSTGSTVFFSFTTVNSSGVPTAFSSGGVTAYRDGSTIAHTTGITLTSTFNGVVGFNRVQVDMAGTSTFYQPGADFVAIISSGAASESLAGYVLAHWSVGRKPVATVSTAVSISTASLISTSNVFASVASVTGNVTGSVGSVASATGIALAVWGATRASYVAAGSFGESISTGSSIAALVWNINAVVGAVGSVTGSVGSVASATGLATAIWGATRASYTAAGSFGESISTGSSTIMLDTGASTRDDFYNNNLLILTAGGAAGQARMIDDYDGTSKVVYVAPNWIVTPASTSVFVIVPFDTFAVTASIVSTDVAAAVWNATRASYNTTAAFGEFVNVSTAGTLGFVSSAGSVGSVTGNVSGNVSGSVGSVASATGLATAIWGATRASYTAAGSFGESISTGSSIASVSSGQTVTSVTTVTGNVTGSVGSVASATGIATAVWGATRSSYVAAGSFGESISTGSSIASVSSGQTVTSVTTVTGNVTGSIGSLTTAAAVQVNAEVVDALATDSTGAPAGAPPASASIEAKTGFLYAALRHGIRVGSSGKTFLDASSAVQWVKGLVDDGSTYAETLASTST